MAIQDTRMTLNKEKNQSSKEEQKTITQLSQEDIMRISKQEAKIYEEAENYLLTHTL